MKEKFVISKSSGANDNWSYLGPKLEKENYILDEFRDRFILTTVEGAVKYDTYEGALEELSSFKDLSVHVDVEPAKTLIIHQGFGIYKITKVFVIEKSFNYGNG